MNKLELLDEEEGVAVLANNKLWAAPDKLSNVCAQDCGENVSKKLVLIVWPRRVDEDDEEQGFVDAGHVEGDAANPAAPTSPALAIKSSTIGRSIL